MDKQLHYNKNFNIPLYTCDKIDIKHAFTSKFGGISKGDCESLNLGFSRGDERANVMQNYKILTSSLDVNFDRITMTQQVHDNIVCVVDKNTVGMGIHKPMNWNADAIITNLKDTPIIGYYADCVVTLLYDKTAQCCGVCHAGWRGMANGILPKTIKAMCDNFGSMPSDIIAVLGPSICKDCFETDSDVPIAMRELMGDVVNPFISEKGVKFHVDLRGIGAMQLKCSGLSDENIIDSGICTKCNSDVFWSHRATNGKRGVQGAIISL